MGILCIVFFNIFLIISIIWITGNILYTTKRMRQLEIWIDEIFGKIVTIRKDMLDDIRLMKKIING